MLVFAGCYARLRNVLERLRHLRVVRDAKSFGQRFACQLTQALHMHESDDARARHPERVELRALPSGYSAHEHVNSASKHESHSRTSAELHVRNGHTVCE